MSWNPKIETCWVDISKVGFGTTQYTCFSREHFTPIGIAWVHGSHDPIQKVNVADLLNIYVVKEVRRKGVAGLLIKEIFKIYETIFTTSGSKEGGKKFIKSIGFKYLKKYSVWAIRKNDFKKPKQL